MSPATPKPSARQLAEQYGENNLEQQPLQHYLGEFQRAQPVQISNRLGIPYDHRRREFSMNVFGSSYAVSHPDFQIRPEAANLERADIFENIRMQILLLRYLLYASVFPHNGEFKSYRELPSGEMYFRQFNGRCVSRLGRTYGAKPEVFCRVMDALGGMRVRRGDAACELEVFDSLYLRLMLWAGDEEFPASAEILFSSNFPAAFSVYDLAELADVVLWLMKKTEERLENK